MACKCKVSENIDAIYKKYGDKKKETKQTNIRQLVSSSLRSFPLYIAVIPAIPFMLAINIFKTFTKKTIKIGKR